MDIDFWAARVHSSKHISAVQSARNNKSGNYDAMADEGSEEVRAWFPCPFCYVEIEVPQLSVHLQEEHCFDLKNAVCPICAAYLGKDALGHFTVQHAHSIKRRKKSQKSGFWSNISADIVRDFRELSSFVGGGNNSVTGQVRTNNEPSPDPLLSTFVSNMPLNLPKENQQDVFLCVGNTEDAQSKRDLLDEVEEHNSEEKRKRAEFIQELLVSTIF